ncbi:hypothetical protein HHK36_033302 [Tetracentron sinense]|uniref:Uncharacterized protein n=1 Tax=Tetracentron sinense TaxID=13715 RepID=A0A834Y6R5_TETSI|nr:hypothetical protein HHK36_033302 [Tetracentron sinense]
MAEVNSPTAPSAKTGDREIIRRSAHFHPSVWGDHFLASSLEDLVPNVGVQQRIEELKKEVNRMLNLASNEPMEEINLIDTLQRLGIAYHFEKEIGEALQRICDAQIDANDDNLYAVALRFRLLRQQGYNVSADVFSKFKDKTGRFRANLTSDIQGMLSLYEASHLSVRGEDILDEALVFTSTHLKTMVNHLTSSLAVQVGHALELPLHKRCHRIETKHYISIYQEEKTRKEILLELAKLDFNQLQLVHQREIRELSKCDHGVIDQLPEYMKVCFRELENLFNEIEDEMITEKQSHQFYYVKQELKNLARAYFGEAQWFNNGYVPKLEEYLQISMVSSVVSLFNVIAYIGMGKIATKEAFDWVTSFPKLSRSSGLICRLMDDIKSNKFEQKRGHVASSVQCYMKEYEVSEEEACKKLQKMVEMAWKDMNNECLAPTPVPFPLLMPIVNLSRMSEFIYMYEDGFTESSGRTKESIASLLVDRFIV